MVTTGTSEKSLQSQGGPKRTFERTAEVSLRLIPELAPANLISELDAGVDYYVTNLQNAISAELSKQISETLNVWFGKNHSEQFNQRLIKRLANSTLSPGLNGIERTRDALTSGGVINPDPIIVSMHDFRREANKSISTDLKLSGPTDLKCKICGESLKKNKSCITEVELTSKSHNTGTAWHIECAATEILRDETKKYRSAKGSLDKQAIAVRGILGANKGNAILRGEKEGLQDIGTSVKYENWLNALFENWTKNTTVKEEFHTAYQNAFSEYANAIVEFSNTGNFPIQATKKRLLKHLSSPAVESILKRAIQTDLDKRMRKSDSDKLLAYEIRENLDAPVVVNYLDLMNEPLEDVVRVVTIDAKSYADAPKVAEAFRAGNPVVLNCTQMAEEDAKRIIDFVSGLVFGNHGNIERVTRHVFLLSPTKVSVIDESSKQEVV